jgi:uncharacterized protein Usg
VLRAQSTGQKPEIPFFFVVGLRPTTKKKGSNGFLDFCPVHRLLIHALIWQSQNSHTNFPQINGNLLSYHSLWRSPSITLKEVRPSMTPTQYAQFLQFLQNDLELSASSIAIAQKQREQDPGPLPIILWQYGLVTLEQLDQIYDWLEAS